MKILHILKDGPASLSDRMIQEQSKDHQVEVVDLSKNTSSYEILIEKIFAFDKVVCW
jgi:TusA-related sulfurtransferase